MRLQEIPNLSNNDRVSQYVINVEPSTGNTESENFTVFSGTKLYKHEVVITGKDSDDAFNTRFTLKIVNNISSSFEGETDSLEIFKGFVSGSGYLEWGDGYGIIFLDNKTYSFLFYNTPNSSVVTYSMEDIQNFLVVSDTVTPL